MKDIQKSMKFSLIFGLCGAVILPVVYEIYANISSVVAVVLLLCGVVYGGLKFSTLSFREAFLGITCTIAYSGILGFLCYLFIHPMVQKMLDDGSVYFQLTLQQQAYFMLYAVIIMLCMYGVCGAKYGVFKAIEKFRSNNQKTKEYIDNAFDDTGDE